MRSIINISLPPHLKRYVTTAVKDGGFSTTSEFFRTLLRLWREKQIEIEKDVKISREEIRRGKGKILKSLADLD